MRHINLTDFRVLAILAALISCRGVCFSQQTVSQFGAKAADEPIELIEARNARASAEKRVLDLELELEKLRGENQALKEKYAGLYLQTHETLERLRNQELAAANLIQGGASSDGGMKRDDALEALNLTLERLVQLQGIYTDYRSYVSALADTLQVSEAAKGELERHGKVLQGAVEAALKPLTAFSQRGRADRMNATVVSVNDGLGLFILDRGALSGVRSGREWFLSGKNGKILAKLKTVECRAEFSAAMLTEGDADAVRVGSVLSPLGRSTKASEDKR